MVEAFPTIFLSGGCALAGRFFRNPASLAEAQPTIVVMGSWLTVKEQMASVYARRLAEQGFTAFVFDFSGFGQSEGAPRQTEIPSRKIIDLRAAVDFVKTMAFVQPSQVGVLAICASAQYTLAALADQLPVVAFVSVAGWYHDVGSIAALMGGPAGVSTKLAHAKTACEKFFERGEVDRVPAYAPGNVEAGMQIKLDYYGDPSRGAIPSWKNEMAVMSWMYWLNFDGLRAALRVRIPVLMIHGDQCMLPDNARKVYSMLPGPKQLIWTDGSQIDFYDQPASVSKAVDAAAKHFRTTFDHLGI